MIRKIAGIILFVAGLHLYVHGQQRQSFACRILEIIALDRSAERGKAAAVETSYRINDTTGEITAIQKKKAGRLLPVRQEHVIFIDTFRFFTPGCSNVYGNQDIEVRSETPDRKLLKPNMFFISGISTARENALAIAIFHPRSNHVAVYYIAVSGNDIRIIKRSGGDF